MDNWNEELQLESYLSVYSYKSVLKLISLANEPVIKLWCLWAIENFNQLNGKLIIIKFKYILKLLFILKEKTTLVLIRICMRYLLIYCEVQNQGLNWLSYAPVF